MAIPNIVFGSSGLVGLSLINHSSKGKIKFIYTSREKPNHTNIRWHHLDLNKKISNFKYNQFNTGIFLSSPSYLKKNLKHNKFNRELYWLKKITDNFLFSKIVYISSSTIYYKKHPIGGVKKKCEKYLQKKKHLFDNVQIWRPFNLIGSNQKIITDHFHNLLFKKLFIEKKKKLNFKGNINDVRGYSDVNEFVKIMLREAKKEISFVRNFGNPKGIKLIELLKIFDKEYFKINNIHFKATFSSKHSNINLINKKLKNSFFSNKSSKMVIKNYLKSMLNSKKNNKLSFR